MHQWMSGTESGGAIGDTYRVTDDLWETSGVLVMIARRVLREGAVERGGDR